MPRNRLPAVRQPCEQCKAKHVKCDDGSTSCRRCIAQNIECVRRPRKTTFLPGSSARYDERFTGNESWVSGSGLEAPMTRNEHGSRRHHNRSNSSRFTPLPEAIAIQQLQSDTIKDLTTVDEAVARSPKSGTQDEASHKERHKGRGLPARLESGGTAQHAFPCTQTGQFQDSIACNQSFDLNQACLLRYFIDHIAQWFDTCDERRHFQLVLPVWARQYPPLLNAICATSSRHLCRTAKLVTTDGIHYEGQLLAGLTAETSVKYMLTCMPALRTFHEQHDRLHRNLIVATAVLLRQFEEMEDESDYISRPKSGYHSAENHHETQVNFLDIINAIIRDSHDEGNFNQHELLDVAYWICLRQEVYSAFTQKRMPQMLLAPEQWAKTTTVNKAVMHAAQVAKWLFEDQSSEEWGRLNEQQGQLEQTMSSEHPYMPILRRPPTKENGEVFPTIWFGSDLAVIGVQHMMIAKMVLVAEAPDLAVAQDRHIHRKVEAEVRNIILDLCGIAMHRPSCPPTLVNAIMGILLYGDFFTDSWERQALASVIERFRSVKAWPLPEALRSFF